MGELFVGAAAPTVAAAGTGATAGTMVAAAPTVAAAGVGATAGTTAVAGLTATQVIAATAVGLGVAGQLQAGAATEAQVKGAKNIAEYNALVQKREAEARRARAAFLGRRQAEASARAESRLRAALGKARAVPEAGAPLQLVGEQEAESEIEQLLIAYEGEIGAQRAESQADIDWLQSKIYGKRAKAARLAGFFGAGETLLKGFA